MTIPLIKPASLTLMQHHTRLIAAALFFLPLASAPAEEPTLRDLLRDGLYAEEVARDPESAAKNYEQLLARYGEQRDFASSALFRLAEVRRKQDRKDDAIQLYQRLLAEFPGANTETKLARENLAALGGKPPEVTGQAADPESLELARLESLAKTAPDIILDPETLSVAAEKGWGRVVAYLMAAGSQPYAGDALRLASGSGYLEIVKQLMAGALPIPPKKASDAIWDAMQNDRSIILEFLLQKGLTPEREKTTALIQALLNGKTRYAECFVKHGIDLNETSGEWGQNPSGTALAAMIYEGNFDAADWLLAKGAKPDHSDPQRRVSPLHYAALGKTERSFTMMQKLLEAGADPNRQAMNLHAKNDKNTLQGGVLLAAIHSDFKIEEKVRLLLKHKADPNLESTFQHTSQRLLEILAKKGTSDEALKLLIEAGAKPNEEWLQGNFRDTSDSAENILIEKFTVPKLANDSEIHLLINNFSRPTTAKIAERTQDESLPDLVMWLLANHESYQWMHGDGYEEQWRIWRKTSEGVFTQIKLDFSSSDAMTDLHWGDVVEFQLKHTGYTGVAGAISSQNQLSPQTIAALRKRIAFPITFETDGKTRELTVRGDRLFFDPTKNEVPMVNLQGLVSYFWQQPENWGLTPTIHVTRKGWPDVRLSLGSKEAEKFPLEKGDQVKLEVSDQNKQDFSRARKRVITLKADGYPYSKFFGKMTDEEPVMASIPSLVQMLTDAQNPYLGFSSELHTNITEMYYDFTGFVMLPHPDLSDIRIRRLEEGGAEKVIKVNLAKIIAASNDQTTAEEARKADVMLQIGDVVEVPLIKAHLDDPWKGFSKQEDAFFAKALSGRVRVTDQDGNFSVRDLVYIAPRYNETGSTWIPVPPESGMSSTRGWWLEFDAKMDIKRGEFQAAKDQYCHNVFLRDGDEIALRMDSRSSPPMRVGSPQPTLRRVSQPTSGVTSSAPMPPQPVMVPPPSNQPRARVVPPPPPIPSR